MSGSARAATTRRATSARTPRWREIEEKIYEAVGNRARPRRWGDRGPAEAEEGAEEAALAGPMMEEQAAQREAYRGGAGDRPGLQGGRPPGPQPVAELRTRPERKHVPPEAIDEAVAELEGTGSPTTPATRASSPRTNASWSSGGPTGSPRTSGAAASPRS